jgi:hypothetical protein
MKILIEEKFKNKKKFEIELSNNYLGLSEEYLKNLLESDISLAIKSFNVEKFI